MHLFSLKALDLLFCLLFSVWISEPCGLITFCQSLSLHRLFLRDGRHYCNRVYFAHPVMTNVTSLLTVKIWWWCSTELLVMFHTLPLLKLPFPHIALLLLHCWQMLWNDGFTGYAHLNVKISWKTLDRIDSAAMLRNFLSVRLVVVVPTDT